MPVAWATMCIQHTAANAAVLDMCVTSIASLLITSVVTPDVVVLLDDLAYDAIGNTLRNRSHVLPLRASPVHHDAAALRLPKWATPRRIANRKVTIPRHVLALYKMQVWRLVEYDSIVYFDTDVLFLRDASVLMTHSQAFAAIALRRIDSVVACKGDMYLNAGVMKLKPSHTAYHTLRATLLANNYTDCGGEPLTDQDVVRQLAFSTNALGPFHQWPLCFNYRGWPNQRRCLLGEGPMLSHQERRLWPTSVRAATGKYVATVGLARMGLLCESTRLGCSRSSW